MAKTIKSVSIFVVFFIFFLVISGKQIYSSFLDKFVDKLIFTLVYHLEIYVMIGIANS